MRRRFVGWTLSLAACGQGSAPDRAQSPEEPSPHVLAHCGDALALQHWLPTATDCLHKAHGTYRLAQMTREPDDMATAYAAAEACLGGKGAPDGTAPTSDEGLAALSLMVAAELQSALRSGAGWIAAWEQLEAAGGAKHPLAISQDTLHWLTLASGSPWAPSTSPKGPVRGDADEWMAWARWQLTLPPAERDGGRKLRTGPRKAPDCAGLQPVIDQLAEQLSQQGPGR